MNERLAAQAARRTDTEPFMAIVLPPLYAILSADTFPGAPEDWARRLAEAGAGIIQYRDKRASAFELLRVARRLSDLAHSLNFRFIVNDRADVAAIAGAGGVHVGQEDLPVEAGRRICGPDCCVGVSTHNFEQLKAAAATSADYIAIGPIYATNTKANPDPVVGVEFIRQARQLTRKPLVAIGGITAERAAEVYAAGADSIAVAADLAAAPDLRARVQAYLRVASHR
ncbi:MAG TPA: thiamine phosphate synthase [Candidatus Acidoferrales bacterium]|nr:thiamine phosphate synthase [Candidatus Acidoferrales bacterium]